MSFLCPCHSGALYEACCQRYHTGVFIPSPLLLMRSRYSAYVLNIADYIMNTTHRENPSYTVHRDKWRKEICQFSQSTSFDGLHILCVEEGETMAFVTFTAVLQRGEADVSFTEKSQFIKVEGAWLYSKAVFVE